MIDTDKYEGTNWDLRGQFTHTEMADEVLLLVAEVKRLRKITDFVKSSIDFHYHSIDNNTGGFVNWMEFARELHLMLYGGDE
jgi:hypothetical protein|tara:strand:+ start:98 stop:343 length:246 start_codon:yes stop_codon:yes gene_type:complete